MLERLVKDLHDLHEIENAGWVAVLDDLHARLCGRGHSETVKNLYEQAAVHFALWITKSRIQRSGVTDGHLDYFVSKHLSECRCKIGGVRELKLVHAGLWHLKVVLDAGGYRAAPEKKEPTAIDREVDRFDEYLQKVACLKETTRKARRQYLREFLTEVCGHQEVRTSSFDSISVIAYMVKRSQRGKAAAVRDVATGLRSYFRFLQFCGEHGPAQRLSVPFPVTYKLATIPRVLTDEQISGLLGLFDRQSAVGCRDYAITRCLLDLALRPGEVASLKLEDINWRAGTIQIVRSKSRRESQLPLPATTARAIADYLRRVRVRTSTRNVFLHIRAPIGQALKRQTISGVVRRAGIRVPIKTTIGARTLRQTAASRMVRCGASLKEVADVLRHRQIDTSLIYAKVNLAQLAGVAAPWPYGGQL
jgi:integrase/recombinase XerD